MVRMTEQGDEMRTATRNRSHAQLKRHGIKRLRELWAEVTEDEFDEGFYWYDRANVWVVELAVRHSLSIDQVAGIASSLSPRLPWHRAIVLTERLLNGEDISNEVLGRSARKAREILAGLDPWTVVSGPKTTSFAHNLTGDYSWVTIDTHSFQQVSGRDYNNGGHHLLERVGMYEVYSECFRIVAREAGLEPAVFQAILWIHDLNQEKS
jgi:hypothetical protein